jgi:putative membrane protein
MIQWWCTAQQRPFTWRWIPYPGIWLAIALPTIWYLVATARSDQPTTRRQRIQFLTGMAILWLATDWPLGTLGAGYLASAHMAQSLLYVFAAVPLLMLGTPEWLARRVLRRLRLERLAAYVSGSLVLSGAVYTVGFLGTHVPGVVDTLRTSQVGSFAMDVVWVVVAVVLWMPVISPIPSHRAASPFARIGYLMLTTGLMVVVPATLLTFARFPVYRIYELAPRVGEMVPRTDQQLAGIFMRLGPMPVVGATIGTLFVRWARKADAFA